MADPLDEQALTRWRLILGRFAEPSLGSCDSRGPDAARRRYGRMDRVLDYLYGREYRKRGVRGVGDRHGGLDASALQIPEWLGEVRELFPQDTVEIIERHALNRYGMTELVTDAEVLRKLEPSYELLKAVLTFKGMMQGEVLAMAHRIVRKVVEEMRRKLEIQVRRALWGRLNRRHHSPLKVSRNLDWRRTLKDNLKNYDRQRKQVVLERLHFFSRVKNHMPWHVILAVDCSGSMMDSVIHSAVMAGIFAGLPALRVSLVAFDTAVIDLSDQVADPVELLMSVQLGGGTDIAGALGYCESLVQSPSRTLMVLVTDFFEGASPAGVVANVKRMRESGVRVLGLAALDATAQPTYDRQLAEACVAAGAEVAALTPQRLAEWMAQAIS